MPSRFVKNNLFKNHAFYFGSFFPTQVTAFTADNSIDFARRQDHLDLTTPQKKFILKHCKVSVGRLPNTKQIHGRRIDVITQKDFEKSNTLRLADGLATDKANLPLSVRTADCLAVFIFDPKKKVICLVHAGWKGSKAKIAVSAVKLMQKKWKTNPKDLKVAFSPSIRSCCYKVGEVFIRYFPKETIYTSDGFYLDLPLVNKNQLMSLGVKPENIFDCHVCTCCDKRFFSYRRQGEKSGRMISVMMLKK